jgi:hypothetical protein
MVTCVIAGYDCCDAAPIRSAELDRRGLCHFNASFARADRRKNEDESLESHYVHVMRGVYTLMNAAQIPSVLTTYILRSIFSTLSSDTLAFLAGTWLLHDRAEPTHARLRHTSLAHAYAFLTAHEHTDHTVDFQTIVPALLVAFQDADGAVRQAAGHCMAALRKVCEAPQADAVYAFDSLYGASSAALQYLDWADVQRYVSWLCEERAHFARDALGVRLHHRDTLGGPESGKVKKKFACARLRLLCCVEVLNLSQVFAKGSLLHPLACARVRYSVGQDRASSSCAGRVEPPQGAHTAHAAPRPRGGGQRKCAQGCLRRPSRRIRCAGRRDNRRFYGGGLGGCLWAAMGRSY